jgi:hypothetical protein
MKSNIVAEDDPTVIKMVKKVGEFQLLYFPLLTIFPLNICTGTSKAFAMVDLFFVLIAVILFNMAKLHRGFVEHVCVRVIL